MSSETQPEVSPEKKPILLGRQIIILMGAEGSGKTSIGKRLSQESGKPYLSVGDILRDLAANDPGPNGEIAREMFAGNKYFMDRQKLLDIYAQRFQKEDLADGFILDGALRDTIETEGFQSTLEKAGRAMPVTALFLKIPGWLGVERLSSDPTARGRNDDDSESVIRRLSNFYNRLGERISIVKRQPTWRFIHIDASGPKDQVYEMATALILPTGK